MIFMTLNVFAEKYAGRGRDALLPLLWDVQTTYGFISADAVHQISQILRVPEAEIYGVVEFYSLFHTEPTGEKIIYVCADPACALANADTVLQHTRDEAQRRSMPVTILRSTCLGLCDHAPAALIAERGIGERACAPCQSIEKLLQENSAQHRILVGGPSESRALLTGVVGERMQRLQEYGDYAALRQALLTMIPATVIEEVRRSELIGRGGAAFPTSRKWQMTADAPGQPHYLVCNADESEPGTFKDRVLMEAKPHLLLEGMAIAAFAVGASHGYLFVRGEYPEAARNLQAAIEEAEMAGWLGEKILGTEFSFTIELRRGAGAYICGEETALFEAIEGKRGFPRTKPPYPTTHGLFGKPTTVNNVETLCSIPLIIERGAEWFRHYGTEQSKGTKLVCVSGHVERPGVYEIAFDLTLRELLEQHCGGVIGELATVLVGGASGTFLAPDEIEVPLTFEDLRKIGSTLGSGAIMVFNTTTDLRDVLLRLGHFFQHESCGKCFPCQLGTQRQLEILERLKHPLPGDQQRLLDIGHTMTEASLCGLGQTAAAAVLSAMKRFPELFESR